MQALLASPASASDDVGPQGALLKTSGMSEVSVLNVMP